jgi:hypothetical protein
MAIDPTIGIIFVIAQKISTTNFGYHSWQSKKFNYPCQMTQNFHSPMLVTNFFGQ